MGPGFCWNKNTSFFVLLFFTGILAYSLIGASMVFKQREAFGQNWNLVKCLGLLEISALVFSMSLCNFSLAYLITLIYVPVGKFKHNLKKYISVWFEIIT